MYFWRPQNNIELFFHKHYIGDSVDNYASSHFRVNYKLFNQILLLFHMYE